MTSEAIKTDQDNGELVLLVLLVSRHRQRQESGWLRESRENEAGQLKRRIVILNSNRRPCGGWMTEHTRMRMRMQQADMRRLLGWLSCCLAVLLS